MPQPQVDILIKATTQGFTQVISELNNLKQSLQAISQTGVLQSVNNLSSQLGALSTKVTSLTGHIDQFTNSVRQNATAMQGGVRNMLSMQLTLKSYIEDVTKMIAVQARWYGARMLLFTAIELPMSAIKSVLSYTIALDTARSELMRFAATSGNLTEQMATDAEQMVLAMRRALVEVPVAFKDLQNSIQSFVGAGVAPDTIIQMTKYIAQLKNAFPEIEMETFAIALTGAFNQFGSSIKTATTDAEKFKVVIETLLRAQAVGIIRPEQFTKVLQYMGPMSTMAGFTLQQMASIAVVVTDMGRRAESAARLSAGFMNSLVSPKAANNLEKIGIHIDKSKTLAAQFDSIASQLISKIGTGAVPLGSLQFISGLTSSDRLGVFISFLQNYEKFVSLTKDLEGSAGGLNAASAAMSVSIVKQWQQLINLAKEFGVVISEGTGGAIGTVLGFLNEMAKGLLLAADAEGTLAVKMGELGVIATATAELFLVIKVLMEGLYAAFVSVGWAVNSFIGTFFFGLEKIFRFIHLNSIADFAKDIKEQMFAASDVSAGELKRLSDKWLHPSASPAKLPSVSTTLIPKPKSTKGTGIDTDDEGRAFDSKLISNIQRRYSALYSAEESALNSHLEELNVLYKFGIYSIEEYNKEKEAALVSAEEKELEILNREKKEIEEGYKVLSDNLDRNKKLKPGEKRRAEQQLAESKESDLAGLETKITQTSDRINMRRYKGLVDTNERLISAAKKRLDDEKTIEIESGREIEIIEKASLSRREEANEWLYESNYLSATEYYDRQKLLIEEQAEFEKSTIRSRTEAELNRLNALQAMYGQEDERWKNLERDKEILQIKSSNDLLGIEEETSNKLQGVWRKRAVDLRATYEDEGILGVTRASLKSLVDDFSNTAKQIDEMWKSLASDLSSNMSDLFFDVMVNDLKSLEDYLKSFLNSISRALANLWAQQITSYLVKLAASGMEGVSFAGIFGSSGTGGGATAPTGVPGITTVTHTGGKIGISSLSQRMVPAGTFNFAPRLHTGLASDEYPAILQRGETVLPRGFESGPQSVKVQIVNESGQKMSIKNSETKINGQELIVTAWLDALQNNKFGLRNAIGG